VTRADFSDSLWRMKPLHWVIVIFWIFVVVMIFKQCHDSNTQLEQQTDGTQQHFFFSHPPEQKMRILPATNPDADVEQVGFSVDDDTPSQGSFTCNVTLKNLGGKTATGVQVAVRPFRGGQYGDNNVGHAASGILPDDNPLAQLESWVAFPDLPPGHESTQSVIFLKQVGIRPGNNPHPEINFQTAKDPSTP
jgi:hypothetical protein